MQCLEETEAGTLDYIDPMYLFRSSPLDIWLVFITNVLNEVRAKADRRK